MSCIADIREFVVDSFLFGDDQGLADDTPLFERGIIDSTGILEMVSFVEERYDITVADEELVPANFESMLAVARYVDMKNGKPVDPAETLAHD
jgi:acyl carrier protein